jgi:hypothetical protein
MGTVDILAILPFSVIMRLKLGDFCEWCWVNCQVNYRCEEGNLFLVPTGVEGRKEERAIYNFHF